MSVGIDTIVASIHAARQAKALTQKELGQRVGLPQSHISKIEKGAVDFQISSLVEIARALDLEVKLVPRAALPTVEGVVRAYNASVETSRALHLINEQTQLAERIKARFPELAQIEDFQNEIRKILRLQFNAAELKALNEALRPAKYLKSLVGRQESAARVAKQLEEATSSLKHFLSFQIHPMISEGKRQLPAYRLEEDD